MYRMTIIAQKVKKSSQHNTCDMAYNTLYKLIYKILIEILLKTIAWIKVIIHFL